MTRVTRMLRMFHYFTSIPLWPRFISKGVYVYRLPYRLPINVTLINVSNCLSLSPGPPALRKHEVIQPPRLTLQERRQHGRRTKKDQTHTHI